jgi:hypothetical protein
MVNGMKRRLTAEFPVSGKCRLMPPVAGFLDGCKEDDYNGST